MARKALKQIAEATVFTVASATGLNVREKPDKSARVIRVLGYGERVQKDGEAPEGWISVKGGFVMERYLK